MKQVERPKLQIEWNAIDRFVDFISPINGQARKIARMRAAMGEGFVGTTGRGGFIGARRDRRATENWGTRVTSADAAIVPDLATLRDRSRDLAYNAPLALGALNTVVTNVIGRGLQLQSRINSDVLGLSNDEADAWQSAVDQEFRYWAEKPHCDLTLTQNFYQLQSMIFRSVLESGDNFVLLPFRQSSSTPYLLKIQSIEADRVTNQNFTRDTLTRVGGVELDDFGAPKGYWIMRNHPGAIYPTAYQWDFVPAFGGISGRRNVLHLFDKRRPGQNRGFPYLAPVIETLKQLDRYTEAEITAAVISGMFTVFITTEDGSGMNMGVDEMGAANRDPSPGGEMKLGSGAILEMNKNEDVKFADPKRPNTAFDPFVMSVLRQVGVALELPFEILIKHFTSSYSASRAAILEAWRFFRGRREWIADALCQPIYEAWLEEAVARGRITAPGFFSDPVIRAAWCGAIWRGDSPGQIDPTKEVLAAQARIEGMFTTYSDETILLTGMSFEDVVRQRQKEKKILDEAGLTPQMALVTPSGGGIKDVPPQQQQPQNAPKKQSAISKIIDHIAGEKDE